MSLEKLSDTLQGTIFRRFAQVSGLTSLVEIVRFREMIQERIDKQEPPLQSIPDEHLPLIAKFGHDR